MKKNSWFEAMTSRLSLFWRYFFFLALMMCTFLTALTLSTQRSSQALQNAYLEQTEASFYQNSQAFAKNLFRITNLPSALEEAEYYRQVIMAVQPMDALSRYHLSEIREHFYLQSSLMDLSSEGFLYFGHIGSCVTRNRTFPNVDDCFSSYIVYEGQDMQTRLERLAEKAVSHPTLSFLPVSPVRVDGAQAEPCLTLLLKSTAHQQVYGFLYSVDSILDAFHVSALPEDTWLRIVHTDGTVLFSHNDDSAGDASYAQFSAPLSGLSCTAVIGVTRSYFQDTIRSAQDTAYLIFLVCAVLGILMCVVFSHISVRPFRRLIRDHADVQTDDAPTNEVAAIDAFLKTARERSAALRSMLLSSLLVRTFSGLPVPEEEYKTLSATFPLLRQPLRVAILRDRQADRPPEDQSSMIRLLRSALPEQFLCEYINMQETVVLFRAEPAQFELLQCVLLDLNQGVEEPPRFVCGVSAPFVGLKELSGCVRQAQFCVPEDGDRVAVLFTEVAAAQPDSSAFDLKQFQQSLACWNQQEVLTQIDAFVLSIGSGGGARPEEVFYSVLHLLRDTAHTGGLSFRAHEGTAYQHTSSPASNLRHLKVLVNDLFDQRAAVQLSEKQQLCRDIVQYMKEHFSDPTLCLFTLAQQFCISERFVHSAILSITGMNFSNFLTLTRMQEAARLLRETEEPINAVAERCGYTVLSTFYRNFKKHYHVTPVEYKEAPN